MDFAGWLKAVYTDWSSDIASSFTHNYSDPSIGVERSFTSYNIQKGATFTNSMGYRNPRVDELFRKASRETDVSQRKAQFAEIQQIDAAEEFAGALLGGAMRALGDDAHEPVLAAEERENL